MTWTRSWVIASLLAVGTGVWAADLPLDPPAFQASGVTMVPAQPVAAWLGLELVDTSDEAVVGRLAGGRGGNFKLRAGEPRAMVLNEPVALPHAPLRGFGDLLVPLRFLAEQAGAKLLWLPETRQVELTHGDQTATLAVPPPVYPLATGGGVLIGGLAAGSWLGAEKLSPLVPAGITWRGYGLAGEIATATGAAPVPEQPGDYPHIAFTPAPDSNLCLFGAPWQARTRPVRVTDTSQETYLKLTRLTLETHGLPQAKARLSQVLRVDLDGDGTEEVLLSASNRDGFAVPGVAANDYSFVLLRQVDGTSVRNTLLCGEFYPTAREGVAADHYSVAGVLDLDGDGTMEIIIRYQYYEGYGLIVVGLQDGKAVERFQGGVGA